MIPGNARVPNVTGLLYGDAAKRLAESRIQGANAARRASTAASPKETVLEQDPAAPARATPKAPR